MHLVIYFCGTGNPGDTFGDHYDYVNRSKVCTVFVKGCDEPEVCNSGLFPNLKAFANRFVGKLFKAEDTKVKLAALKSFSPAEHSQEAVDNKLLESIGVRLDRTTIEGRVAKEEIESITLCGYSRGAVTCFEVARALHRMAPQIPVDIVADQPVPGNSYQGPLTNAGSIADCSDLTNLRNVSVILGSYTGSMANVDLHVKKEIPEDLTPYKNSYLFVGEAPFYEVIDAVKDKVTGDEIESAKYKTNVKPYYVNSQGELQELGYRFGDYTAAVFKELKIDANKERKYSMTPQEFSYLVDTYKAESLHETERVIHRGFFSQILPKLPRKAHRDLIIIPRESHHQDRPNAPTGEEHMHMQMAKYLDAKTGPDPREPSKKVKLGLVKEGAVERKTAVAKATYSKYESEEPTLFPVASKMQGFFGLGNQAYRYIDKLHPKGHVRKGMQWNDKKETLLDWWQSHENTSRSTQLTKELVKSLKTIDLNNKDELIKLFKQTDRWLMLKENSSTSRYYQVECLRGHIKHYLEENHGVLQQQIAHWNREELKHTDYFLKHWTEGSKAASWFKTKETEVLDQAFLTHSSLEPSEKNDRALLKAMDTWLTAKEGSSSSRYDLVLEMYEHLSGVIQNNYGIDLDQEAQISLR
ncbi:hypothetical protein [Legionella hackeliae]|uniref:Uncharacterized protein n=1 Tax=Legionella hackeliae TaxID=449 RepID=A0A0A8UMC6_LEGHA|nr:hypothetical protein [Legionella hackeliae]KTD10517.1 hypothetical protein Lhac_2885 [Legionella hackeliae]CEK10020.1 protein of unknown function [Legionella hackeliae]STX46744.1 Uncharacterised protein [Legionella hackeliae]